MERGSDKHSARMDEAMKGEVQGLIQGKTQGDPHAEEWKQAEPAGEDQPDVDRAPGTTLVGGTPVGMSDDDVAQRSEVARFLRPMRFPLDREGILADARELQAPAVVLEELQQLPAGQLFVNVNDMWAALGHGVESGRNAG